MVRANPSRFGVPSRAIVLALTAVLGSIAGCGSSDKPSGSSAHGTATTSPASKASTNPSTKPSALAMKVALRGSKQFGSSATATPGESVVFQAQVPTSGTAGRTPVSLTFHVGPGKRVSATAAANGKQSTATVTGKGRVSLVALRYTCQLPPLATPCPAKSVSHSGNTTKVTLDAPSSGITVSALVGPVKSPSPGAAAKNPQKVGPYTVGELIRVVKPGSTKSGLAPLKPSVSVKPGDVVNLFSFPHGPRLGARQTVTITIGRGPATALAVSTKTPGGKVVRALVRGAGGKAIRIGAPMFTCYLPPTPTFCPAESVRTTRASYVLRFKASPSTPTIQLVATVAKAT